MAGVSSGSCAPPFNSRPRGGAAAALQLLESRRHAATAMTLSLDPPPKPVARRERQFVRVGEVRPAPPPPAERPIVLDGFVLLEAAQVDDPEIAERVVLEGCAITTVVEEDLAFFTKLTHLDLGDNHVQLAPLGCLPALKEVHLDCNGLTEITVPPDVFRHLEVLNLSFNGIRPHAILALAALPALLDLDLSANKLTQLPDSLAGFHTLRRLSLDDNELDSEKAFLSLATIPRLASLSLAKNKVERLPANLPDDSFPTLMTLSLINNNISDEAHLLPLLKLGSLTTLLLYGNPCIHRGETSNEFAYVMGEQRGVNIVAQAPPPPAPPSKLSGPGPARVVEPPTRRQIMALRRAPPPQRVTPAETAPHEASDEEADDGAETGSSFFMTGVDVRGTKAKHEKASVEPESGEEEGDDAAFARLVLELSRMDVDHSVDMPTAVAALRRAVDRVDDGPPLLPSDVGFLKRTAAAMGKVRSKYVPVPKPVPPAPTGALREGRRASAQLGSTSNKRSTKDPGTLDAMNTTLTELHKKLGKDRGASVGSYLDATDSQPEHGAVPFSSAKAVLSLALSS